MKITRDPSSVLKNKLNKIIATNNAVRDHVHINQLIGNFTPRFIYGNVKTHKKTVNPPLRPIISQVTAPTYPVAKQINSIIQSYLPKKYSIESTDELLHILRTDAPQGTLASLDAENLFTNVPIDVNFNIILKNVYETPTKPPPIILRSTPESLLRICTQEAQFRHIDGSLHYQIDGVAMGSPLGPAFANFYVADLKKNLLENPATTFPKPLLYLRYVDDIIVIINSEDDVSLFKEKLEENSVLKFTHELGSNKLQFLDVDIEIKNNKLLTKVFSKSTKKETS